MADLSSTTVFITGATAGFGAAAARRFSADGAKVIITGRRKDRLDALKNELSSPVHAIELDVRDRGAVEAAIAGLPNEFASIDVLLNNAGLALGLGPAYEVAMEDWEQMIDTNIRGLLYCTRAILPGMVERNRGHVINLGSVAGTYPYPGGNVYGGTKAFVHQFSLNLRADLLGKNVRVTSVEPGMAETEFSEVRFKGDKGKAAGVYADMQPMTADDIANVIHFVATCPPHLNVNTIELMPTQQAFAAFAVNRG
ncbi:MAG: NAD(P)-dependent oxidoreductase [Rhodospirillaceae bacterium]|jgi:3-hydroxy acid dehydrogenase/malonic semialdehyde reductase|nr:NAD(P)-dependent oxidoreductase [Rhodospirillaceae bacterium]